eukprot:scaffold1611_cov307-Pinguiococcus_pyrenoidosus.AAC.10
MLSPRRALGARRAPKSPALPNASGGEMTDGDDADGGGSVGAAEAFRCGRHVRRHPPHKSQGSTEHSRANLPASGATRGWKPVAKQLHRLPRRFWAATPGPAWRLGAR